MASLIGLTADAAAKIGAILVYSTVEGAAFLFSRRGASILVATETAILFHSAGPRRVLGAGFKALAACVLGRTLWALTHAAHATTRTKQNSPEGENKNNSSTATDSTDGRVAAAATAATAAMASIWDWEPPTNDPLASGAYHIVRELAVTANSVQAAAPEVAEIMSRPEMAPAELFTRLYYLSIIHEAEDVTTAYELTSTEEDSQQAPEEMLQVLREMTPLATFAYDFTTDATLSEALSTRKFHLLATKYEADLSSGCPAYFLALSTTEKERKEVVLCVRGTYSPEDVFTDLLAVGVAFGGVKEGDESGNAHAGMAKAALFLADKFSDLLCALRDSGYLITLMGHSLGAGISSLLALYLCEVRGFTAETLRCVAYEPPACMDLCLAEKCSDVVVSVVHGDDSVPRMAIAPFIAILHELAEFDWRKVAEETGKELPTSLALLHQLSSLSTTVRSRNSRSSSDGNTSSGGGGGGDKGEEKDEENTKDEKKRVVVGEDGAGVSKAYNPVVPGTVIFVCMPPDYKEPEEEEKEEEPEKSLVDTIQSTTGGGGSTKAVRVLVHPTHPVLQNIRLTSHMVTDHFIDKKRFLAALG